MELNKWMVSSLSSLDRRLDLKKCLEKIFEIKLQVRGDLASSRVVSVQAVDS